MNNRMPHSALTTFWVQVHLLVTLSYNVNIKGVKTYFSWTN